MRFTIAINPADVLAMKLPRAHGAAVFMSGLMSSVNGVRENGNDLPHFITTFPEVLAATGCDTALLGKSHLQTMTDFPTPIGANPSGMGQLANAIDIGDENLYRREDPLNWRDNGPLDIDKPFYGFATVDLVLFHGDGTRGHHASWLAEQVDDPEALSGPENQLPHDYGCPQAIRTAPWPKHEAWRATVRCRVSMTAVERGVSDDCRS